MLSTTAAQERAGAVAAFAGCNLGGTRQWIHVLASTDVVQAAGAVFYGLRRARDCVATADQRDLQGLRAVKDEAGTLRHRVREVVRRDVRDLLAGSASGSA
ncbi:hypothetical protein OHB56_33295 [Streptomyces sp. NBC_01635]|uniref:hypothetical protein n=1 Tax=Streptomyces sp. NBC_01635 TaxID=2975904 RepID=UPI0038641AE4|nr:hypothetical protein OHB56_33295 [Streptomyces sp. NBC_01635]